MAQLPASEELSDGLRVDQEIIRGAQYFSQTEPELVRSLARRLRAHHRKVGRLGLGHESLSTRTMTLLPRRVVFAVLLLPLALYGFLHNAVPYYLPRLLSRPYRHEPEMIATVKMTTGAGLFLVWYIILTGLAAAFAGVINALFYGLSLPLGGLVTLAYDEQILRQLSL
jgi:hypothetical protein